MKKRQKDGKEPTDKKPDINIPENGYWALKSFKN